MRIFWRRIRAAAAGGVIAVMLGGVGIGIYDTAQIQDVKERLTATNIEQRLDKDEQHISAMDKELQRITYDIEHPHSHNVPCVCTGIIAGRQEEIRISLAADCDSRGIDQLKKTFPMLRCHPGE